MPLARIIIQNFKSIQRCDIALSEINTFLGENGTGKTNLLEAINYFYENLISEAKRDNIFDENNRYSNEVRITFVYDLSEFVKIAKSNSGTMPGFLDGQADEKSRYGGYYTAIIAMASKSKTRQIPIELSQIKGGALFWNCKYEDRLIIKSLFPVFYVDTRTLDVTEWKYLWDIIGELSKVSNTERKTIEGEIHNILLDPNKQIARKLKDISELFESSKVGIKVGRPKEFATNLAKLFFSGEEVYQSGRRLNYYSTGTNSVKYIELLLKSIDEISKAKMKEPIVLFDEPEISLHTRLLDELSESLLDVSSKLCIILSTHSARLVRNIVINCNTVFLFHVTLKSKHSEIRPMKKFAQYSPESKYRVTDAHINSYFSRAILFVEGESELELFANPYLKLLFPKLKDVDVFKALSDRPTLEAMTPASTKAKIPYMHLIDMDKAIKYDHNTKKFNLQGEYFIVDRKERLRFHSQKEPACYLSHQRKRLEAMAERLRIHYFQPYLSCDDLNFHALLDAAHEYLMSYHVFMLRSTIEGTLINKRTLRLSLDFLRKEATSSSNFEEFQAYWETLYQTDQINTLRLIFGGRSDLLPRKTVIKMLPDKERGLIDKMAIGKKTSGWISKFLDSFFQNAIGIEAGLSQKLFRRFLENPENRKTTLKNFEYFFPELYSLINKIYAII